jgi:hypothetical protein
MLLWMMKTTVTMPASYFGIYYRQQCRCYMYLNVVLILYKCLCACNYGHRVTWYLESSSVSNEMYGYDWWIILASFVGVLPRPNTDAWWFWSQSNMKGQSLFSLPACQHGIGLACASLLVKYRQNDLKSWCCAERGGHPIPDMYQGQGGPILPHWLIAR